MNNTTIVINTPMFDPSELQSEIEKISDEGYEIISVVRTSPLESPNMNGVYSAQYMIISNAPDHE